MKYCNTNGVLRWSGGTILLKSGMSIDDDHPLVTERPELWNDQEPGATVSGPQIGNIERGTAAPGEVRVTPGTGRRGTSSRVPKPKADEDGSDQDGSDQ